MWIKPPEHGQTTDRRRAASVPSECLDVIADELQLRACRREEGVFDGEVIAPEQAYFAGRLGMDEWNTFPTFVSGGAATARRAASVPSEARRAKLP